MNDETDEHEAPKEEVFILSVGDPNHEPTPELMDRTAQVADETLPDRYAILVVPYYVDAMTTDDLTEFPEIQALLEEHDEVIKVTSEVPYNE